MKQTERSAQAELTEHNYSKRSAESQSALMTGWEMLVKLESIRQYSGDKDAAAGRYQAVQSSSGCRIKTSDMKLLLQHTSGCWSAQLNGSFSLMMRWDTWYQPWNVFFFSFFYVALITLVVSTYLNLSVAKWLHPVYPNNARHRNTNGYKLKVPSLLELHWARLQA